MLFTMHTKSGLSWVNPIQVCEDYQVTTTEEMRIPFKKMMTAEGREPSPLGRMESFICGIPQLSRMTQSFYNISKGAIKTLNLVTHSMLFTQ